MDQVGAKAVSGEVWQPTVRAPLLERWQCVQGTLLIRLAKLFVEREGATVARHAVA